MQHCIHITGRALVATHEYHRAVEFYESAIRELNKAVHGNSSGSNNNNGGESKKGSNSNGSSSNASTSSGNSGAANDLVVLSHDLSKLYIKLGEKQCSKKV